MRNFANRFVSVVTLVSFSFSQLYSTSLYANYTLEFRQDDPVRNGYVVSIKAIRTGEREKPSNIHLTYNYGRLCASKSAPDEFKIRSSQGQHEVTYDFEDLSFSFLIDRSGNITLRKLQADQEADVLFEGLGEILLDKTELRNIKNLSLKGTHIKNQSLLELDRLSLWARGVYGEDGKITNDRKLKIRNSLDVFLGGFENSNEIQGIGRNLTINMHDNTLKSKLIQTAHELTIDNAAVENNAGIKATQKITVRNSIVLNKGGAELNANEIDFDQSYVLNQSTIKAADLTLKNSIFTNADKTGSLALLKLISMRSKFANGVNATMQSQSIDITDQSAWTNHSVIKTTLFNLKDSTFENNGKDAFLYVEKDVSHKNGVITNSGIFTHKGGAGIQAEEWTNNGCLNLMEGRLVSQKFLNGETGIIRFSEKPWILTDAPSQHAQTVSSKSFINLSSLEALEDLTYDIRAWSGKISAKKSIFFSPRYQQEYSLQARNILESLEVNGALELYLSQFDLEADLELPRIHNLTLKIANPLLLTKRLATIHTDITVPSLHVKGQIKPLGKGEYERSGGAIISTGTQALHYNDYVGEYDLLESAALWLDGKNSHTMSGVHISHQVLAVDTPQVFVTQGQKTWSTQSVCTTEQKNKKGKRHTTSTPQTILHTESLPIHVSGLWLGGMITNHFHPNISQMFPDRRCEGACTGKLLTTHGGLFKSGIDGIAFTYAQHDYKANIDAHPEAFQLHSAVYSESGSIVRHVMRPTIFDSQGPLELFGDSLSFQGTQIIMQPKHSLKISAQNHLNFPGLKVKQDHSPFFKKGKHGSLYKVIGYHEEGLPATFTSLEKAEVTCASGDVIGFQPTIHPSIAELTETIKRLPTQYLSQFEDSICVWKAPSKKRRAWASVAGIVTGLVATYLTGGMASGWASSLIQGAITGLSSHTSQALVIHKGHMREIRRDLVSDASIRGLIASMVTAGSSSGLSPDISTMSQFVHKMTNNIYQGTIRGTLSAAIQRQNMPRGLIEGAKSGAINTVFNTVAHKIGKAASPTRTPTHIVPPKINRPTQIVLHGASGAAQGFLLSSDRKAGAIAGAGGAMVGEGVAPLLPWEPQVNASVGKASAAVVAALTNQNVQIANESATNALDNNYLQTGYLSPDDPQVLYDLNESREQVEAIAQLFQADQTLIPLEDTLYRQTTRDLEAGIENCYRARTQEVTLPNFMRIAASYGLDGVHCVNAGLDLLSLGAWSTFGEGLDYVANGARNATGRTARFASKDQRFGQNVGDYTYLTLSLMSPKKFIAPLQFVNKAKGITGISHTIKALDLAAGSLKERLKSVINHNQPGSVPQPLQAQTRNPSNPQNRAAHELYKEGLLEESKNSYGDTRVARVPENIGQAYPKEGLRRDPHGKFDVDSPYPHTQLGKRRSSKGEYPQAREFYYDGIPVKDIDFTDHGIPHIHPLPHQHRYKPNDTGGTMMREERAEILTLDNVIPRN